MVTLPEDLTKGVAKTIERPMRFITVSDTAKEHSVPFQTVESKSISQRAAPLTERLGIPLEEEEEKEEIQNDQDLLRVISSRMNELSADFEPQRLIRNIINLAQDLFNAESASLNLLYPPDENYNEPYLKFYYVSGEKTSTILSVTLPLSEMSLAAWILQRNEPIIVDDVQSDPRAKEYVSYCTS